ncbi:ABC transporter substrate-binding protein [Kibdelosporangium phytohabitans]|uniref:Sugar ABC transporter substrate-binding protein n=1 Tax=Kibdelosporangium phytohabitans TaxID=860235 RepID=A0A0N9HP69_9PSEU|nr:ABC transporter substrate-binding protein [Kibdelosporangium phytohabitans]ALG06444.1 sugar ABC transporter substrate-binding protein [Kibdelosporangium phytohabitans]MBE1467610.1 multiple sugar transport system substrate-binding protein [Kibdelosporangium phytohabitans]
MNRIDATIGRRTAIKGLFATMGLAAVPGLGACGDSGSSGGGGTGTVSLGSNYSDAVPKGALDEVVKAFAQAQGLKVNINTKDHEAFQQQINSYLQAGADDVWSWFAGFRLRFFAQKQLVGDISELWKSLEGNYTAAQKEASTGDDGKQYFVPFYSYPWAVFYRPSIFQQKGYAVPKTFDELIALATKMKGDNIAPMAAGQKNGWPQLGTFDQINFRTNGYQFHVDLMAGKEDWAGPKVRATFDNWKRLMEFYQPNSLGRDWQEAAQSVLKGEAGMMVVGSQQIGQQFSAGNKLDDLDFFAFPEIDKAHGQDTIEAPIDGFCQAVKPRDKAAADKLLTYISTAQAQQTYLKSDPTSIAASNKADSAAYNKLQQKCVKFVNEAKHITQFLDRDTDPGFASEVAINSVNDFIKNPNDVDGLVKKIASQAKQYFQK